MAIVLDPQSVGAGAGVVGGWVNIDARGQAGGIRCMPLTPGAHALHQLWSSNVAPSSAPTPHAP